MSLKHHLFIAAATSLSLTAGQTAAQTRVTSDFNVTITIDAQCQIVTTEDMDFGTQGVLLASVDAAATLSVACTNTTPYQIGLDEGTGSGATAANRLMTGGGNTISYALYQDAARSVLWGDTDGSDTQAATGTGAAQEFTVYGRVASQTTPAPGSYTDNVTVTVTY